MLQLVKNKGCSDDEGSPNETFQLWGIRHQPLEKVKERLIVQDEDDPLYDDELHREFISRFSYKRWRMW
jgi:hypothetical protein